MLAGWQPCWEKASHLVRHSYCLISFSTIPGMRFKILMYQFLHFMYKYPYLYEGGSKSSRKSVVNFVIVNEKFTFSVHVVN